MTGLEIFMDNIPIWAALMITLGIIIAGFEGGFILGKHRYIRLNKEKDSLVGPMVAATLGLLAFMLSFSFGVASSHFTTRKQLVLDEANAIRSVYEMSEMLSAPSCAESKKLLREYVNMRLIAYHSIDEVNAGIAKANGIQDQLWAIAMAGEAEGTGVSSSWLYVQSLSDMINMQAKRINASLHGQIQPSIWFVLYWLAFLGMAGMGYHAGLVGIRGFFAYPILILTFSLVLVLIYDLDRPKQALFKVSQQTMIDLQKRMAEPETLTIPIKE